MKRIIYCSRATFDLTQDELVALLTTARENNAERGVTGMLLYSGQSFLQLLEGDADEVDATYASILEDDRHEELRLMLEADVDERMFPDWTMGFEQLDDDDIADGVEGYRPEGDYPLVNPDLISNGQVAQRLLALHAHVAS